MTPEEARLIVAQQVAANLVHEDPRRDLWEEYPEIGEGDWRAIVDLMDGMYPDVPGFAEAYALLEARAENTE